MATFIFNLHWYIPLLLCTTGSIPCRLCSSYCPFPVQNFPASTWSQVSRVFKAVYTVQAALILLSTSCSIFLSWRPRLYFYLLPLWSQRQLPPEIFSLIFKGLTSQVCLHHQTYILNCQLLPLLLPKAMLLPAPTLTSTIVSENCHLKYFPRF